MLKSLKILLNTNKYFFKIELTFKRKYFYSETFSKTVLKVFQFNDSINLNCDKIQRKIIISNKEIVP